MHDSDRPDDGKSDASTVPALVNDYRAQEDACRAQARELARLRQEVFATASREAGDIVAGARSEVRRVVLKARRDLLLLAAQVEVVGNMEHDAGTDAGERVAMAAAGDVRAYSGQSALTAARHDLRAVVHEASSEFDAVGTIAQTLQRHVGQLHDAVEHETPPALQGHRSVDVTDAVDAAADTPRSASLFSARALRVFVIVFAVVGAGILLASRWWIARPATAARPAARSADIAATPPSSAPVTTPEAAQPVEAITPPAPAFTLEARRPAWIRVTQDGRVAVARLFEAGETLRVDDAHDVSVRAGDAGAVFVSVHGAEPMPLGRDGQVVTRNYALVEPTAPVPAPPQTPPAAEPSTSAAPLVQSSSQNSRVGPADSNAAAPTDVASAATAGSPRSGAPALSAVPAQPSLPSIPTTAAPATARVVDAAPANPPEPSPARTSGATPVQQNDVASAAERWLDAYYKQDRSAMASLSAPQLILSDERNPAERLPPGLAVRRSVDDVSVRIFGNDAMYVAKVTERPENGGPAASTAFVSQMWTVRDGVLRLTNVRIVSATAVNRTFR